MNKSIFKILIIINFVFLIGCSVLGRTNQISSEPECQNKAKNPYFLNSTHDMESSFYGKDDSSNAKTASGEIFNPNGFTAAHRTLPFGTKLEVTNPENGKTVVVRINDRGPFKHSRDLDLSYGAARSIGLTSDGVKNLTVKVLTDLPRCL